jgi:hypothetical protein
MESDSRFYTRRAKEELAAASRAVTQAARKRRMHLAGVFLERLKASEASALLFEHGIAATAAGKFDPTLLEKRERAVTENA